MNSDHNTSSQVTAGVVGYGRRFRTAIAPALSAAGVRICFAVEPSPAVVGGLVSADGRRVPTVPALTPDLLRETAPSIVVISSPSGLHFEQARTALDANLPTFVEKPLARTAAEARLLQAAGASTRLVISEQRPYRADFRLVGRLMRRLGGVRHIYYEDLIKPSASFASSWRNQPRLAGGGIMFDLGYHTVNALCWLLPEQAGRLTVDTVVMRRGRFRVEDEAYVHGVCGEIAFTLRVGLSDLVAHEALRIVGRRGRIDLLRRRGNPPGSTMVSRSLSGVSTAARIALNADAETESLRRFLLERTDPGHVRRHVRTVRFLEQVYLAEGRG